MFNALLMRFKRAVFAFASTMPECAFCRYLRFALIGFVLGFSVCGIAVWALWGVL